VVRCWTFDCGDSVSGPSAPLRCGRDDGDLVGS
jgi:hypothetical protein